LKSSGKASGVKPSLTRTMRYPIAFTQLSHIRWIGGAADSGKTTVARRGKPSFGPSVSDPERARSNLLKRDLLLANYLKEQIPKYGYRYDKVDGSISPGEMADRIERRFALRVTKTPDAN
jgi:hypothetical protein